MKKGIFYIVICSFVVAFLVGCTDSKESSQTINTTSNKKEIIENKDELKNDQTISIDNPIDIGNKKVFANAVGVADFTKDFSSMSSLYEDAENIVYGKVKKVEFTDENASPRTIYSFEVIKTFKGTIEPNTIISVGDSNGYVRMQKFVDVYGTAHFPNITQEQIDNSIIKKSLGGAPITEVGSEYVLFLSGIRTSGRVQGGYIPIGEFMGKYLKNNDGLFARFVPEGESDIYASSSLATDGSTKVTIEQPMSLDEIELNLSLLK